MVTAGGDAQDAKWKSIQTLKKQGTRLAFDHWEILDMAIERLRGKVDYSAIAFELVPVDFTVAELRSVHEAIKGQQYDPSNFRRRFRRMIQDGIIAQSPGKRLTASKPAKVYHFIGKTKKP